MRKNSEMKIQETGRILLRSLYQARRKIHNMRRQRTFRVFGRYLSSSEKKRTKKEEAYTSLAAARKDIELFQAELQLTDVTGELEKEVHCFLSFADFFFYGELEDYLTWQTVEESCTQVEDAIVRVESILRGFRDNGLFAAI